MTVASRTLMALTALVVIVLYHYVPAVAQFTTMLHP